MRKASVIILLIFFLALAFASSAALPGETRGPSGKGYEVVCIYPFIYSTNGYCICAEGYTALGRSPYNGGPTACIKESDENSSLVVGSAEAPYIENYDPKYLGEKGMILSFDNIPSGTKITISEVEEDRKRELTSFIHDSFDSTLWKSNNYLCSADYEISLDFGHATYEFQQKYCTYLKNDEGRIYDKNCVHSFQVTLSGTSDYVIYDVSSENLLTFDRKGISNVSCSTSQPAAQALHGEDKSMPKGLESESSSSALAFLSDNLKNLEGKSLPGFASALFGNEKMNIYIGDLAYSVITSDKVIISAAQGELEEPTMKVWTDEETVRKLKNSKDPLSDFQKALKDKTIRYEAVGFFRKVKLFFVSFLVQITNPMIETQPGESTK